MNKVVVLGAGRVGRPCIQYLLGKGNEVYVADIEAANIERCVEGNPNGHALVCDAAEELDRILKETAPDILVCLLPQPFMAKAAKSCIAAGVNYINPSYVKEEMRSLDGVAREKGVSLLCELGLDPGVDHMSASRTINEVHGRGGKVLSFKSWCGALPARKDNNNPIGYKLSWAPASLIGASRREARVVRDGKTVVWPNGETYAHAGLVEIQGAGWFEEYANADSTPYVKFYGMPEVREVYRGTLRYPGWCEMICKMQDLGLCDGENKWIFSGMTYADVTRKLVGAEKGIDLKEAVSTFLDLERCSSVIMKLEWLGLFEEKPVPLGSGTMNQFVECLYNDKLAFAPGEQDVSVMEHRYVIEYPNNKRALRRSTLIDYGIPNGDFSVARLTGLPPAMGAQLILEGKIKRRGVITPTMPEVYEPELDALEKMGIAFKESETEL